MLLLYFSKTTHCKYDTNRQAVFKNSFVECSVSLLKPLSAHEGRSAFSAGPASIWRRPPLLGAGSPPLWRALPWRAGDRGGWGRLLPKEDEAAWAGCCQRRSSIHRRRHTVCASASTSFAQHTHAPKLRTLLVPSSRTHLSPWQARLVCDTQLFLCSITRLSYTRSLL